jgi:hypothetical protein
MPSEYIIKELFKNYETNDGFGHNVWKFYVINCDKVLRKLICFSGERGISHIILDST